MAFLDAAAGVLNRQANARRTRRNAFEALQRRSFFMARSAQREAATLVHGVSGIEQALDFLEANPDYIAALGQPVGFSSYSGFGAPGGGVHGRLNRLRTYPPKDGSAR